MGDEVKLYSSGVLVSSATIMTGETLKKYGNNSMYVSSGGVANSTTVNSSGCLYVSNSGTADNTTVNYYGSLTVLSGGVANSTTVNIDGRMYVSSGGTAANTTVSGSLTVSSGGTAANTTVNFGGRLYVSGGGVAKSTTVNSRGSLIVSGGGVATEIIASSGARLHLTVAPNTYIQGTSAGSAFEVKDAYISGYTINDYGDLTVSSGGTADNTTVNSGYLYISGGVATSTTVNDGTLSVSSGGTANNTTVNGNSYWSGYLYVSSGGVANSTTVNYGRLYVSSGGTAANTTVSGGSLTVSSGGTATNTTVNDGGSLYVSRGGMATDTTVNSDGKMYVFSGGTANSTTVNSGGSLTVWGGGEAQDVLLKAGGCLGGFSFAEDHTFDSIVDGSVEIAPHVTIIGNSMVVASGGTANSTTVNSWGHLTVSNGGTAIATTVNSGGYLTVSSGGMANNITVSSGCYLTVWSGGEAQDVLLKAGGCLRTFSFAEDHTFDSIVDGSVEIAPHVTIIGNSMVVASGGTANSTTVNWGGYLNVSSGGVANSTTVNDGGSLTVSSGGTANSTTVNGGYWGHGFLTVSSGGAASVLHDDPWHMSQGVTSETGAEVSYLALQNVYYGNADQVISKGSQLDQLAVTSGNSMLIFSGGTADNTTVNSYGSLTVSSGGVATIVFNPWQGSVSAAEGASVTYLERDADIYYGSSFTVSKWSDFCSNITVEAGYSALIYSGGTANNPTVNSRGSLTVSSGGTATGIIASAGAYLHLTVASNTYIQGTSADSAFEMKDAYISGYTVNSSSTLYVANGGTAESTTVNNGGSLTVSGGGTADNTTVSGGTLTVSSGGFASVLHDDPWHMSRGVTSETGAEVSYLALQNVYYGNADQVISKGSQLDQITVTSGNSMLIFSGGTAGNITISDGGNLTVSSGGSVSGITGSGGVLENEGIVRGGLLLSAGMTVRGGGIYYLTSDIEIASGVMGQTQDQKLIGASTFSNFVAADNWHVNEKMLLKGAAVTSGGSLTLYKGAQITTLANAGYLELRSKANARGVTVSSGASLFVDGGLAALTTVSRGGVLELQQRGSSLRGTVYGRITVSSGGTATATSVGSAGELQVLTSGVVRSTTVTDGSMTLSGGTALSTTLVRGYQSLFCGQAVSNTLSGGSQLIGSLGQAVGNTLSGTDQKILSGGLASNTTLTDGNQYLSSGAYAKKTSLRNGSQSISGGALAEENTLTGGTQLISSGGSAVGNTLYAAAQNLLSGAVADSTTVYSGGNQFVSCGALAKRTTVGQGGAAYVYAGASACSAAVHSGGAYTVEDDACAEDVTVADGGRITVRGTVKNLTIARNAQKLLDLNTAVFLGGLDCYLEPGELEDLHSILLFSELETLTLRVNASQFGQDQYDVFDTEGQEEIAYRFMLMLDNGKAITLVDGSRYWYCGECYDLRYDDTDGKYQLSKQTQEKTHVLLSASGNIDVLEDRSQELRWEKQEYQSYGEVIAIRNTGAGTVYLNTSILVKGPLQNAAAIDFSAGGTLQLGTNTMTIQMYSEDEAEAIVYGVVNADTIQRRLPSAPAVPQTVTMNVSAASLNGSAFAAGYRNDRNSPAAAGAYSMVFSGGIAGKMEIHASGATADARGIWAGGRTLVTEPVNNTALVTAEASEGNAFAQGITRVKADEFDFDWSVTARSAKKDAEARGAAAYEIDQFTEQAKLSVSASASGKARAGGFVRDAQETVQEYCDLNVAEKFAGTLTVRADGESAYAIGVEPELVLNGCAMAARIDVSASGTADAEACGLAGISYSDVTGSVLVSAISDTADAEAQGWQGTANILSGKLQVSARGVTDVRAFGFAADEFTPAQAGGVTGISKAGCVSVRAESTNREILSKPPVYAIGGRVDSFVQGTVCAAALAADPVQETYAAAVYGAELDVSGIVAANAATRAAAVTATDEKTTLSLTVSGSIFAGKSSAAEEELLSMLKQPAQYREALKTAKQQCLHAYSVYTYDGDDTVSLASGAAVYGDMEFAAGQNSLTVSNGAVCCGTLSADDGSLAIRFVLDTALSEHAVISCDKAGAFAQDTTTVSIQVDQIVSNGCYKLADGIGDARNVLTEAALLYNGSSVVMQIGGSEYTTLAGHGRYRCYFDGEGLYLEAADLPAPQPENVPKNLQGDENGVSWDPLQHTERYVLEYSTDEFSTGLRLYSQGNKLDTFAVPQDSYSWHVRADGNLQWSKTADFDAWGKTAPQKYKSDNDGVSDIFFASGSETWGAGYAAQHVGAGNWKGTGERVLLRGKTKMTDVFAGSSDANLLVMTDGDNGDALFVDDIYSAFPEEQQQSRLAQIDEIRAGAGNDIVDMTSQQFDYAGDGLTIRGGAGDDTVWANKGSNMLFGDAGNDRLVGASGDDVIAGGSGNDSMHGGGGDDIFCFSENWGIDTVEQLAGSSVTLWFEKQTGSWDQSTLTYSDGVNSVTVKGLSSVTLKFGDDGSESFDQLCDAGAFLDVSSENIFEEKDKGVLASL